ncbi:MAG TPA: ATP-binding protein [Candidatus Krumholzibacteriaceae bacterium]|nr:ATP-binding protein [Candidatus Krumholzibacteriaceae bacterium]
MNFIPRAYRDDEKIRNIVYIRIVVATLIVGAAIIALQFQSRELSAIALYSLLGVVYLGTGAVYIAHGKGVSFNKLIRLLIGIDLAVLTLIVHYSGGSGSIFSILYILPIFVGGLYFGVSGGLVTSLVAASAYIVYSLLEISGHVRSPEGALIFTRQNLFDSLLRGYIHMGVFVSTGLISGYFSKRVKRSGKELADREKEIKRIQLNNDSIVNNMSSGLVVIDLDGCIVSMNPAARRILEVEKNVVAEGKHFEEIVPGMTPLFKQLMLVMETGVQRNRGEITLSGSDGRRLPIGINISLLKNEVDEKKGVVALFQDLTEVNRMRDKIRRSDRMAAVGELSAAIAHEIRAPLASICGSTEMLKDELDVTGENGELMDLIIRESDRLDGMITDFLEYARLRKPEFDSIDIENCLKETILLLKHGSYLHRGADITFESDVEGVRIYADDEQIRQVFLNLGLNACEAVRRDGSIYIRVRVVEDVLEEGSDKTRYAEIEFTNDGPRIPDDVLEHIFEPFFTTKDGGTGLGLATAGRIIESHSGSISAENLKEGVTFRILIPVEDKRGRIGIEEVKHELSSIECGRF